MIFGTQPARTLGKAVALAFMSQTAVLPTLAQDAFGVDDPAVAYGLAGLSDWDTGAQLLDLARSMRPFFAFKGDTWESLDHAALRAGGHLDANGYPKHVPPGHSGIRTIWGWSEEFGKEGRTGTYILTYAGTAKLALGGAARTISAVPGRIVFENPTGTGFWLDITGIDPNDPFRSLSVIKAENVALAEAGAVFDPKWLSLVADARELRFMDWMRTTDSAARSWADRPTLQGATWTDSGAPVELMVRLANETGTDPWFTMPHQADPDYVRAFATYVRDNLDPRLKAHVEYSNELWNAAFQQFHWLREQAIAAWGEEVSDDWEAIFAYHSKRATEVALIWQDVFSGTDADRLINVLGTQIGHVWLSELQLTAPEWERREPDAYVAPHEVFEELAATTYFGVSLITDEALRAEMISRFESSGDRTFSWLFEKIAIPGAIEDSIPAVLEGLGNQRALADDYGQRLVLYEGGQHVHHTFFVDGISEEEANDIARHLGEFVRSPEMGALYSQIWDGWREIGQGPFMQFNDVSMPTRWGSWGMLAFPDDQNPRASFIMDRAAQGGSWWGEGGGPQYLQGVIRFGSEGADTISGTVEEDYLVGLGGDDTFLAGPGSDGINGGSGQDIAIFPGQPGEYTVSASGPGHLVTGPSGATYLFAVETIRFGDGTEQALD
ncbi:calcium-binding protein [Rhodobacter sp. HX-7-19]|uniref:Calcium-binding protein n=1 Tax=Paragemmobacter kunshanensis TaxID=2583234 RepID=A0A6M1TZY8_9RHOB|nr:calcium-binding protein [Rhodobacter kunshanensis]NGQ92236.1 calcium-binding protein [Rhodobacter kunshanensis]